VRRWIARARRLDPRRIDYAVAVLFVVVGALELIAESSHENLAANVALFGIGYSMLAWRRRAPVPATAAMLATWLVASLLFVDVITLQVPLVAVLVMAYAMGAYTTGRDAVLAPIVLVVGMGAVGASLAEVFTDYVFPLAFSLVAYLAGRGLRTRTRLTEELHEAAVRAKEAHEEEVARAAVDERRRIAREMHDVVAHSLSVMVVQAEAAEAMLDGDPDRARRPLAAVQQTGRDALGELRRMLGVLREMADQSPDLAPQPGLSGIDELVEHVRQAGLPVSVRVEGDPRPLPPGIDLSAYRIVQEGLTNALKHAGPASAEVVMRYGAREIELEVRDDGRGGGSGNGGGHGLLGMRERVAIYGGDLTAGPRPEGGFALVARLPLEARSAS